MDLQLTVKFERDDEDGFIVAEVVELPGIMSQGRTQEEAERNITDAIFACFETIMEDRNRATHRPLHGTSSGSVSTKVFRLHPEMVAACY